jgi:hypothetical protein
MLYHVSHSPSLLEDKTDKIKVRTILLHLLFLKYLSLKIVSLPEWYIFNSFSVFMLLHSCSKSSLQNPTVWTAHLLIKVDMFFVVLGARKRN